MLACVHGVFPQPKLTVLPHTYLVLVCWCVGVLVYGCCMMLACVHGVFPQPKLTVLPHTYLVLVCWCVGVWVLYDASMRAWGVPPA